MAPKPMTWAEKQKQKNKKTFGQKFNDAAANAKRKIIKGTMLTLALVGLPGVVGYYHYGTIEETEAKITGYKGKSWDYKSGKMQGNYAFHTTKGTLALEPTMMHGLTQADVDGMWNQASYTYKTYVFQIYGDTFLTSGKVIGMREVTEEELKARKEEAEAKKKEAAAKLKEEQKQQKAGQQQQQDEKEQDAAGKGAGTGTAGRGVCTTTLSGNFKIVTMTAEDGSTVRINVPVEISSTLQDQGEIKTIRKAATPKPE